MKAALLLALLCWSTAAHALSDAERELLVRSLRPGEAKTVVRELGDLSTLPMKALDVELFPDERRLEGHARLEWTNTTGKTLETLYVRLSAHAGADAPSVTWSEVTVGVDGAPPQPVKLTAHSTTVRAVALPKKLSPGKRVVLQGKLAGRLAYVPRKDTELLHAGAQAMRRGQAAPAQYGTFACGLGICTLTGFAPEVPAFIDGRFDLEESSSIGDATYSEPSNVLLSVVVPARAQVAATGLNVGKVPEPGDRRRWMFVMAGAREVGFVTSTDFVLDEATVNGVRVLSYSLTRDRENGKKALRAATTALKTFDKAFGRYPWAELTIAQSALVGGAGGVELPGLALGAAGLYSTEKSSGPAGSMAAFEALAQGLQTEMLNFVVRHEVAHQWWHALVGTHAQRHPWLDEPLAQWSALYSTEVTSGREAAQRARDVQVEINFHGHRMMGGQDGVAARPAGEFDDQFQYAALVYGKAPLFYAAVEREIGRKKLLSALQSYAGRYRFERATPEDLKRHLVTSAGAKGPRVAALWQRWFHQARGAEDLGEPNMMKLFGLLFPGGAWPGAAEDFVTPDQTLDMLRGLLDGLE